MHFEVETRFASQPHDLLENEPDRLDEERVDKGVDDFGMALPRVLVQNDMVLNKEVGNIIIQVDGLGYCVKTDQF